MSIRKAGGTVGLLWALAFFALSGSVAPIAQAQTNLRGALAEAKPAPGAPPVSQHVESVNFDHWVVTCQDAAGKKVCSAGLRILGGGGKQVIANWQVGYDKDNHLVSVLQVPTGLAAKSKEGKVSSGISMKNGLEMKLGAGAARRLAYVACNAQFCEAVAPVDDAFLKDAVAATKTVVTVYTSDGTAVPLDFESKGLDKAIAAVAAKNL
jgi:invasion protein IalB